MNNIELDPSILGAIKKLNAAGITKIAVVGGYFRNILLGVKPNDIDMVVAATLEQLQKVFNRVEYTEGGIEFGVCRVRFHTTVLEFSICNEEEFEDKVLNHRDFTVNTIYYQDGQMLTSSPTAYEDIANKRLIAASSPLDASAKNPYYVLRAFKFLSLYNLRPDEALKKELANLIGSLLNGKTGRIQREFTDILKGEYVLNSLKLYAELNYIKDRDNKIRSAEFELLPMYGDKITPRIAYLMKVCGIENISEWLLFHYVSENTIVNAIKMMEYEDDSIDVDKKKVQDVLNFKRYLHKNDLEIVKHYYETYKKPAT